MKMKKMQVNKFANHCIDSGIHTAAVGSGVAVAIYCIDGDVCNDQNKSNVAGIGLGAFVAGAMDMTLMKVKNTFVEKKPGHKVPSKFKKAAVTGKV